MAAGTRGSRPTVVDEIERLIAAIPGWTPLDQLLALHTLVVASAGLGGDVLEVGSWCGRSAAVLGHAVRRSGGRVHAVDLFPAAADWQRNPDGTHSFRADLGDALVASYVDHTVWPEAYERDIAPVYRRWPSVLDAFREMLAREALHDVVVPFRGTSPRFAAAAPPGFRCRLVFIDGNHDYDAVCQDIATAERLLLPGGWIAFDDAFTGYVGVERAIEERIMASPRFAIAHQLTRKLFVARLER